MVQTDVARFAEQPVHTLSGGERQRAWLALCLAQQSEVLLLDEPLAALDIVYQVEVLQLVRRLIAERGLTVVMIIHDINLAARVVASSVVATLHTKPAFIEQLAKAKAEFQNLPKK